MEQSGCILPHLLELQEIVNPKVEIADVAEVPAEARHNNKKYLAKTPEN